MQIINEVAYTFDDFLLMPQYSDIESRKDVSIRSRITKNISINTPILSSNMSTITEWKMMQAMSYAGACGVLHRFLETTEIESQLFKASQLKALGLKGVDVDILAASIGVNDDFHEIMSMYNRSGVDIVFIDIAHGHCKKVIELIKRAKKEYPNIDIVAGNVCTATGAGELCDVGVDGIKCGVGPGSLCTTRLVTGHGCPQLTAIKRCVSAAKRYNVPVIGDGGITKGADFAKAIAVGAESIMIGGLLSGTQETPGKVKKDQYGEYKEYYGMASLEAMNKRFGNGKYHAAPEGEYKRVPVKGSALDIVNNLAASLRSAMSYSGARTIEEFQEKAILQKVSPNTLVENRAHGI